MTTASITVDTEEQKQNISFGLLQNTPVITVNYGNCWLK